MVSYKNSSYDNIEEFNISKRAPRKAKLDSLSFWLHSLSG